jgi:hypothetical protein
MSLFKKSMLYAVVSFGVWALSAQNAFAIRTAAVGRGASADISYSSMEFGFSVLNASQDDINAMIKYQRATNAASTSDMGSAYELFAQFQYQFSGTMFSMLLRPSYITASATGSGTGGAYDYKLSGYTFFPMLRLVPLENDFIKFFFQMGLGYGHLGAEISQGAGSISFGGSAFGAMGGIGVDFCFTSTQCLTVEGNLRYLPIERNLATAASGAQGNLTQGSNGQEVEISGSDLKTTLSGVQGVLAYSVHF